MKQMQQEQHIKQFSRHVVHSIETRSLCSTGTCIIKLDGRIDGGARATPGDSFGALYLRSLPLVDFASENDRYRRDRGLLLALEDICTLLNLYDRSPEA